MKRATERGREVTSRRSWKASVLVFGTLACILSPAFLYARTRIAIYLRVPATAQVNGSVDSDARIYAGSGGVYLVFLTTPVRTLYRVDIATPKVNSPNPQYSEYRGFAIDWQKENHGVRIGTEKSEQDVRMEVTPKSIRMSFTERYRPAALETVELNLERRTVRL